MIAYQQIKDRQNEGVALGNLGIAYNHLGDYPKAIEYLQQDLAIAREFKDRQGEGQSLGNLGNAYLSLGDYPKAIEYLRQHLAIAREFKDRQEMLTAAIITLPASFLNYYLCSVGVTEVLDCCFGSNLTTYLPLAACFFCQSANMAFKS